MNTLPRNTLMAVDTIAIAKPIPPAVAAAAAARRPNARIAIDGRSFSCGEETWYVKGFTYGPFPPNSTGQYVPERHQLLTDLSAMRRLGCNAIRLYHPPTIELLDDALAHEIRVMIDVPWEKHRCFFEDFSSQRGAIAAVRRAARKFGHHAGTFAISVANEIPHDIVRFYGARRVERFIENLIDEAKSQAPDCLITYTNYPSSEFLSPRNLDFYCSNVYLHDSESFGGYLNRLQHVAGNFPLVLGEYGVDTLRHGEAKQQEMLQMHLGEVFTRGLAGSFIFSYTDEWFTGGHLIDDWAFGVTGADRTAKPAARAVASAWASVPHVNRRPLPSVSVIVCSYNGAATLAECLASLEDLDYADYEVVLVDDGSTDATAAIAARFPSVRYVHQENLGLSAARNTGARLARGEVLAYTDSDCVADRHWLLYLARAMEDQRVDAIGGPNVPPVSDEWTAKCVAASPGGPSHVMLDDCRAEHVPGCNMAFRRAKLLELGGFDVQFRQAGDDVDICWRFIDAGLSIGFAPAALVWHHRRNTVRAYWKQQAGYGRSEAMLQLKHPMRFNRLGYAQWLGVIYGEGAVGLPVASPNVYHGRFGSGTFQIIYRGNEYSPWAYFTLFEWHVLALSMLPFVWLSPLVAILPATMWLLTLAAAVRSTASAQLPKGSPLRAWPLVFTMHLGQPIVRAWHRYRHLWRHARPARVDADESALRDCVKRIGVNRCDLYFDSRDGLGRVELLGSLEREARQAKWHGDFVAEWHAHDVELYGDCWHRITIVTATEELGWPKRFTRVRCALDMTARGKAMLAAAGVWAALSIFHPSHWSLAIAAIIVCGVVGWMLASRRTCFRSVCNLIFKSAVAATLEPVRVRAAQPRQSQKQKQQQGESSELHEPDEPLVHEEYLSCDPTH
jgi:GT2 family glycosyltransferase